MTLIGKAGTLIGVQASSRFPYSDNVRGFPTRSVQQSCWMPLGIEGGVLVGADMQLSEKDVARFWSKVDKNGPSGCWVWRGGKAGIGYGVFSFRCRNTRATLVSWVIHHSVPPENKNILHKCDNPSCVNPSHLFLGSQRDNSIDCNIKGRSFVGGKKTRCKISPTDAITIARLPSSVTCVDIGKMFGISARIVGDIRCGYTWSDVTGIPKRLTTSKRKRQESNALRNAEWVIRRERTNAD